LGKVLHDIGTAGLFKNPYLRKIFPQIPSPLGERGRVRGKEDTFSTTPQRTFSGIIKE
jgi:hypothetical protein